MLHTICTCARGAWLAKPVEQVFFLLGVCGGGCGDARSQRASCVRGLF